MADIKDLKIKKRTYQFNVKKRYSSELKFKKVEKTPLQAIRETIEKWKKPKGKVVLEEEKKPRDTTMALEQKKEEEKPPLVSTKLLIKAGGALLLVLALIVTGMLFFQSTVYEDESVINPLSAKSLSAEVKAYDLLTASREDAPREPYHTAFVMLEMKGEPAGEVPITLEAYNSVVPSSVYVLRSNRYQAETYPEFINSLESSLSNWGIPVNEVGMGGLASLPSQSLVIVPSGYIPEELLNGQDTRITELLERGVTVLYIGQPFFRMYTTEGAVVSSNPAALDPLAITFDESAPPSSEGEFRMKSALYAISGASLVRGSVSAYRYGDGYLVALPQTLDGGWEDGQDAASDVYDLVVNTPWLAPIGDASRTVEIGSNESLVQLFTTTFEGDSKYLKIYGFDNESQLGFSTVIYAKKSTKGEIYTQGHEITPAGLGSTQMDIMAELNEEGGEERLFFSVTELLAELDREPIATAKVPLNSRPTFPYTFVLPSGDYILNIIDSDGRAYARSYMRVGTLEIVQGRHSTLNDVYRFSFYLDGSPVQVTGQVYVDGNKAAMQEFSNVQSLEVDAAELTGGPLAANEEHTFTFELGEFEFTETTTKFASRSIFEDPLILGGIGIAVVALGIGILFARKGVTMYGLDIPDFPPQSTTKIPMKKEKLLEIFKKVNERYKWKNTPLTLSEIKGGFRNMLFEGKPLFISDYNLEYLLLRLAGMDLVKKELDYYGLTSWEEEAGNTIRYLASFRKLRDICINNAVPFTPPDSSEDYDSKITILGQDIYVHLYDNAGRVIPNALSSLKNGLNIILFEEQAEKSEFYEYLSSGYKGGTMLKLEVQSGSVLLKTWDEFAEMIKEMKV
ncbi:hypothetical protein GF412_00870 [Candidatus Micrarchaeota archaeon]|nr:hypothetical protein [Candidatus Micrarchaeota archaeon]MBD3417525.1 hypothetical protein [Candidatus Micrarchaeota archaeon]